MWPAVLDYGRDESLGILRRLELVMIMMINMIYDDCDMIRRTRTPPS